jgi:7-cyano-7-deazaguanine synthase in queuosine biosynthesis
MNASSPMNMATRLMTDTLDSLDTAEVARSIGDTADEVVRLCEAIKEQKKRPLRSTLEGYGLSLPGRLNAYTLPDAIWSAICLRRPYLYCYPLGEIMERATKKTVLSLLLRPEAHGVSAEIDQALEEELPLGETETESRLRRAITARGIDGLLELFFLHCFFEMSIDYLRRPTDDIQFDLSYWYNFSAVGSLMSLGAERSLRKTLTEQCKERAEALVPFLRECVGKGDLDNVEKRVAEGLRQIFRVRTRGQWPLPKPDKPFLNVIVGTRKLWPLRRRYQVGEKPLRLTLEGVNANVSLKFDRLERFLESLRENNKDQPVHPLVRDLLDLGVAVYMSDRYTKRARHLGRRMGMLMPVRYPGVWSKVQVDVEHAISFLARDDFGIYFAKRRGPAGRRHQLPEAGDDSRCICLLSGGIDSAAGAIWALEKGLRPILVSHYASTRLAGAQKGVVKHLEEVFGTELQHVGIYVNRSRAKGAEPKLGAVPKSLMIQHLRTFLFLSLAAAIALELGIRKIFIFENGPVALNPLFSEARINTRTAHAHFLALFRQLIKAVFEVDLEIANPFAYETKGEVTRRLAKPKYESLISETESCWFTFRVWLRAKEMQRKFSGRHDGDCFPCILRRTAVHHAGLWEKDGDYLVNVFSEFPELERATVTGIADFLRFCKNTHALSDAELLLHAPDFSVCAEDVDPQELITMYRRHSEEVIACFRDRTSEKFRKNFASILGT